MDYAKLKEGLKELITDSSSTEDVEKVTRLVKDLEDCEKERDDLLRVNEETRRKYIEAVKNSTFNEKPKEDESKPKSLEECLEDVLSKRKEN